MAVRAGIVVTGTEVLTGRVGDLNGPWLAEQLRRLGVDVGQIVVVGDRPEDLRSALEYLGTGHDLVITSGGLGPTADDLTAAVVAQVQGRAAALDPALEQRISTIVARFSGQRDPEATAIAIRKQAMVPVGASLLEPVGTAPGLVVPVAEGRSGPPVIVLPGPPGELQQMWPAAIRSPLVRAVLEGASELRQHTVRLWGVPESDLAATLRRIEGDLAGLEITTCLRAGELEMVSRYAPEAETAQEKLVVAVRADFGDALFSADGASVDDLVGSALAARGWTVASAESFTAGGLSSRFTSTSVAVAERMSGGVTVGSDLAFTALTALAGHRPPSPGSLSGPALAVALAAGACTAFGSDVGVGITALEDGTRVHLAVVTPDAEQTRTQVVSGNNEAVRLRIVSTALHLLRQTLET
jgi:nicotinamide-nucleotide amidase